MSIFEEYGILKTFKEGVFSSISASDLNFVSQI